MWMENKVESIIINLCAIFIGIFLLINPVGFTSSILLAMGILLCVVGIVNIVEYFKAPIETAALSGKFTKGLFATMGGIFMISQRRWIISLFPILTMMYGAILLVIGIYKIAVTVNLCRLKSKKWGWVLLDSILTIVCALVIISNPFGTTTVLWAFVAITIMIEAIINIVITLFLRKE